MEKMSIRRLAKATGIPATTLTRKLRSQGIKAPQGLAGEALALAIGATMPTKIWGRGEMPKGDYPALPY